MKTNGALALLLVLCLSQAGCFYWRRSVEGGGRVQDGKYYVLEETAWTWWWFTLMFPSCMTNMRIWSEVCPEDGDAKTCVDWACWNRKGSAPSVPHDELLPRWVLGKSLVQPSTLKPNQRLRMLCNDTESHMLLVQEERRLDWSFLENASAAMWNGASETVAPTVGNCTLWVVRQDDTRIGPYLLPYAMDSMNDYFDLTLRSRYRTNALFCFEPTSQTLCVLYRENRRWYFERWKPNEAQPTQKAVPLPMSEKEPFYFWVSECTVGVASWSRQTAEATFTTFDGATLTKQHSVSSTSFPKPPLFRQVADERNPFEKTPELIRKNGDWLYVVNDCYHDTYSTFSLPWFGAESGLDLSEGEVREYVLRFNLKTGARERYYVKGGE